MKKIFGILICMLLFGTVLTVSGDTISVECIEETSVKTFYFVKFNLSGIGEANYHSQAVLFWKINEGESSTFSILSVELNYEDVIKRDFLKSDTITSPSAGFLFFFKGTVEYDDESGNVEIHGRAIMGVSGTINNKY